MSVLCRFLLWVTGWKLDRRLPEEKKYIIIGAYHTSNWDFVYGIMAMFALKIPFRYLGKHTLFEGTFGWFFRALGGIPVDRTRKTSLVDQLIERFNEYEELVLVLAPEGTRSKTNHWKPGFYHIALGAKVPVALGYLDFRTRRIGVGGSFLPTGVVQEDLGTIESFYVDKQGKYPDKHSTIAFKERR